MEKIIPSFEDRISTDENDLQENLSKINSKIKSKKEISLKILNEINTEKTKGIEEIFGNLISDSEPIYNALSEEMESEKDGIKKLTDSREKTA